MKNTGWIIGVDEVGRGPLAGRIFVGAVLLPKNPKKLLKKVNAPKKLTDSKKLSEKQRNEWFSWVKENKIPFAISAVSSSVIDRINITRACNKAANNAVLKLINNYELKRVKVIADAGIFIKPSGTIVSFKSFPKADETVPAVSLASIVAKVKRDAEMKRMKFKYPQYGFDRHKGYGTEKHIRAIKKYGPSPIHRLTFIGKFTKIR
jgi:ribonuclease HII